MSSRTALRRVVVACLATTGLLVYGTACIREDFGPLVFLCDPAGSAKCPGGTFCASDGLCRDERCRNGVQDGYESDVDCGAFCGPCSFGQRCGGASDCQSRTCVPGAAIPGKDTAARCLCPADQAAVTVGDRTACVDLAEVTNKQYLDFLAQAATRPPKVSDRCGQNATLQPATGGGCPNPRDADKAQHPVVCVDFCDAETYCLAQGKTLCGGFDGQPVATTGLTNTASSVWMAACTDVGRRKYPYTDNKDFTPNECIDQYPSPFVPSTRDLEPTTCLGLRDDCCAFLPAAAKASCNVTANAGNASACQTAVATQCTDCTSLGRCCSHLLDAADRAACNAAVAGGDEKTCGERESLCGCAALSACCQRLINVPERAEQVVECKKLVTGADAKKCREGLALYCPTLDAAGKEIEQQLAPVQQAAGCATRVGQPADLSGNAGEWEDNCQGASPTEPTCTIRGGSFLGATSCGMTQWTVPRSTTQRDIGFRCCSR